MFSAIPAKQCAIVTLQIAEIRRKSHVLAGTTVAIWIVSKELLRAWAMVIQEMTPDDCFELLQQTGIGRLGCSQSGQPYVVPIYFAANKDHIYGFTTLGKKIAWMRANPLVCLEVDEIISPEEWRSVIILGRYQELPDDPRWATVRGHAHSLLEKRAVWWEPAYCSSIHREVRHSTLPVFYRICIDEMTGHRAQRDYHELAAEFEPREEHQNEGWVAKWIHRATRKTRPSMNRVPAHNPTQFYQGKVEKK